MLLQVRDETATGQSLYELSIEFLTERITVRELIRERVRHEVREFNRQQGELTFRGLVQPADAEPALNGQQTEYRLRQHRPIDWGVQFKHALNGFIQNGFFVLIDEQQAESLDQEFLIGPTTHVSFIKLISLVGG